MKNNIVNNNIEERDRNSCSYVRHGWDFSVIRKSLGFKMRRINVDVDKYFQIKRGEDEEGLPRAQGPVMGYLVDHSDEIICQRDLEKNFNVSAATMSNILRSLEKAGLVERIQMETDARLKRIVPTEKGIQREYRVRNNILELEDAMIKGFSDEELDQLQSFLDRISANVKDLNTRILERNN